MEQCAGLSPDACRYQRCERRRIALSAHHGGKPCLPGRQRRRITHRIYRQITAPAGGGKGADAVGAGNQKRGDTVERGKRSFGSDMEHRLDDHGGEVVVDLPAGKGVLSEALAAAGADVEAYDLFPEFFAASGIS